MNDIDGYKTIIIPASLPHDNFDTYTLYDVQDVL